MPGCGQPRLLSPQVTARASTTTTVSSATPSLDARSATAATTSGIDGSRGKPGAVRRRRDLRGERRGGERSRRRRSGRRARPTTAADRSGGTCHSVRSPMRRYRTSRRPPRPCRSPPHAARASRRATAGARRRMAIGRFGGRSGRFRTGHLLLEAAVEGGEEVLGVQERGVTGDQRARSLVISPASTASTQTCSRVSAKRVTSGVSSSLPRCLSPPVQAKIEAIGLVEVLLPFWCSR